MAEKQSHAEFLRELIGDAATADRILAMPPVAAAARGGTREGLHRALGKARRSNLIRADREAIDRARANRRAFLDPVGAPPTLATINGIGARLYGERERDAASGTYVATHYATLVYVPVFPIASYLVASTGPRSWKFFAKVPLSAAHRLWRRALGAGVVAVALAIWLAGRHASSRSDVWFVNGLDVPVSVALGDETVSVAPGAYEKRSVGVGTHHLVTTTASGSPNPILVEELDVDVPRRTDLVAYSVLGAAPLGIDEIVYSTSAVPAAKDSSAGQVLVGEPWVVRDHVEYAFQPPPQKIQMVGSREVRHAASVAPGGWKVSAMYLVGKKEKQKAVDLASRVALAQRDEPSVAFAAALAVNVDPESGLRFAERVAALLPTSIEAHRSVQGALTALGRKDEARERYRAAYEKAPGSASAGYLYARLLRRSEALALLDRLVAEHPDDPWIRRSMGWALLGERRYADAVPHYVKLKALDARVYSDVRTDHVLALAGAGRVPEAQRLVDDVLGPGEWDALISYGRLRRLPDADRSMPDPVALLPRMKVEPDDRDDARAQIAGALRDREAFEPLASSIRDEAVRECVRLDVLASTDLDAAAARAEKAPDAALATVDQATRAALVCELLRTGREPAARRVFDAQKVPVGGYLRFDALQSPAAAVDADDLDNDVRAALALAASRRVEDPAERERLVALARSYDVLRCVVPP